MPHTQNPATMDRASRNLLAGHSHESLTMAAYRAQFLIAHAVRPEMAAMPAALAFGGAQ
jgi:hypothetical protein